MVIGLSGRLSIFISCMSALPMEVTRSETLTLAPWGRLGSGSLRSVVNWPSQAPARVLRLVKAVLASGGASARAAVDRQRAAASRRRKRRGLMGISSKWVLVSSSLADQGASRSGGQSSRAAPDL